LGRDCSALCLLRLSQWYQAEQKTRYDENNHDLEKPGVRLFVRRFHSHFAPAGTTIAEHGRSLSKAAHQALVHYVASIA
jgi:hypothetical protein